jgi:hypothetical protein
MDKEELTKRLHAIGYPADQIGPLADALLSPRAEGQPDAPAAPEPMVLSASVAKVLGTLVPVLVRLLQQWLAHRNLTPGQHPATQQAIDQLRGLLQSQEGQSDAPAH